MASLFSPFSKEMRPYGTVQGQFGNAGMGSNPGALQGNLQAILDLIKKLNVPNAQAQQGDELTRTLEELSKPAVTGRF